MPETTESKRIKLSVLRKVGNGLNPSETSGLSNYRVAEKTIHARFCSVNYRSPKMFKFNINPNTVRADYELWICGDGRLFYLLPTAIMQAIYDDPKGYQDYRHKKIRVVSVDSSKDEITYKAGGGKMYIKRYRNETF